MPIVANLYHEWSYKPACFVSYGGVSAGTRAVVEPVSLTFFNQQLKHSVFNATELQDQAVNTMLDETLRWANALKTLRTAEQRKL